VKQKLTRGSIWSALAMALALASLLRWRKEVEQAAGRFWSAFLHWMSASNTFLVALVLATVALALVSLIPWIIRRSVAPGLGCTFDRLSPEQKGFLTTQFVRGLRRIDVPPMTTRQRWFESLQRSGYVERRDVPVPPRPVWSDDGPITMPYEVTAAAWRELRRNLMRDSDPEESDLGAGQSKP